MILQLTGMHVSVVIFPGTDRQTGKAHLYDIQNVLYKLLFFLTWGKRTLLGERNMSLYSSTFHIVLDTWYLPLTLYMLPASMHRNS